MGILHKYHVTVQYIPVLDPKSLYFFHIGQLSTSALSNCFITIKAVTEKKKLKKMQKQVILLLLEIENKYATAKQKINFIYLNDNFNPMLA